MIKNKRTMPYIELNAEKRTHDNFRDQVQPEHHVGVSPFIKTSIDMVQTFPVDYMHCVLLGVMRKLLNAWLSVIPYKISASQKNIVNDTATNIRRYIPSEFSRKSRTFDEVDRFKATEFRLILLYTGIGLFKNTLKDQYFKHFLLLFYSMRILCDSELVIDDEFLSYAEELIKLFIKKYKDNYGECLAVVYNVHMLSHIVDDCRRLGPLDSFSAFAFESMLGQIKRRIRTGYLPLAQIARRVSEGFAVAKEAPQNKHIDNQSIFIKDAKVTPGLFKNSCVMLEDYSVGLVSSVNNDNIIFKKFKQKCPALSYPCSSEVIHVYLVSKKYSLVNIKRSVIYKKCVIYPFEQKFLVLPLL